MFPKEPDALSKIDIKLMIDLFILLYDELMECSNILQDIKSHLASMNLNPVKIKKPDSAPWMCYINFKCEEERQVQYVHTGLHLEK